MTTQDDFDRKVRTLHAQAVRQVPTRTLEQLRIRRARGLSPAPARGARIAGWSLAAACTAVFALAVGLRQPGSEQAVTGAATLATTAGADAGGEPYEAFATLDEDPDLFLWLASQDALPLAME
ncbi:hypothetical protein [Luteimonas sp. MC1825]|uniref:hypothetical protein n=1 Tax=Luteimonas sp. MC1825 TaxID=2761107 RepID=UPI00161D21B0|nr:hypothetical protein [Luteimonas sp. MC1825]MBB6599871.1 hypothetical protein [Luteimonas sp. MC1825]QOC87585.1 hypothetical protein IDM46_10065 [Luteimonas sp. MC1825]